MDCSFVQVDWSHPYRPNKGRTVGGRSRAAVELDEAIRASHHDPDQKLHSTESSDGMFNW